MKKLTLSVLALATVASFSACKKGEEDPLSLSSRKARLAGEWKVDSKEETNTNKNTNSAGTSTSIDKQNWTATTAKVESSYNGAGSSTTTTNTKEGSVTTNTYSIKKDGTWSSVKLYTLKSTSNSGNTITEDTYDVKESGNWNFLGKNDPTTKNKQVVAFSTLTNNTIVTTKTTNTFGGQTFTSTNVNTSSDIYKVGQYSMIWDLLRLASKEIKVKVDADNTSTGSNASTSGSTTTTTSSTGTNVTTGLMTLKQ